MELHQLLTYTYFVQINTMCIVLEKCCETLYLISIISKGVLEWPNSLRVVRALISIGAVLDSYCPCTLNYFLFWSGHLLISCLQSFQIISHLSYFPTAVSMVSFTVLNQLLSNQLILWKKAVMLGVDCVTSEAVLLISMKIPPPPPEKKTSYDLQTVHSPLFFCKTVKINCLPLWVAILVSYVPRGQGLGSIVVREGRPSPKPSPVPYVHLTSSPV